MKKNIIYSFWSWLKVVSLGRQEPQPAGTAKWPTTLRFGSLSREEPQPAGTVKWPTTLRFGKILGTTSVVRSIENPQDVLQKIHRP